MLVACIVTDYCPVYASKDKCARNVMHDASREQRSTLAIVQTRFPMRLREETRGGASRETRLLRLGQLGFSSPDQFRSKRSRFITLFQAATKSFTNASFESSHA
jgi:hypothetical protein